jgi:hypothetical protein
MLANILAAATATLPAPVSGDFDRDGRIDVAALVATGGGYDLVVRPGDSARGQIKVMTLRSKTLSGFYLGKAKAGVEATACAKGIGRATDLCAVRSVTLTGDTLQFGTTEASRAVALWADGQFRVVWLSD